MSVQIVLRVREKDIVSMRIKDKRVRKDQMIWKGLLEEATGM